MHEQTSEKTRNLCTNFTETFSVSKDKDTTAFDVTCEFDMSLLHDEDILELARRSLVISQQGRIRSWLKADPDKRIKTFEQTSYKVPVPGTRTGAASKVEKVKNLFEKMTAEERAELIALYSEK